MGRIKKPKQYTYCSRDRCGNLIPAHKRSDAKFCSDSCRKAEEKKRYCKRNPDYVKKQRRLVAELYHVSTYGDTTFLDNPIGNMKDRFRKARALGYRSGLEVKIARLLDESDIPYRYEKVKVEWEDLMYRTYTPDIILSNGIIIEVKGRFTSDDRRKHLAVKKQHATLDIRFVFESSRRKLSKGAKTTYGQWCDKHGFMYADRVIPQEWLSEKGKDTYPDLIVFPHKKIKRS